MFKFIKSKLEIRRERKYSLNQGSKEETYESLKIQKKFQNHSSTAVNFSFDQQLEQLINERQLDDQDQNRQKKRKAKINRRHSHINLDQDTLMQEIVLQQNSSFQKENLNADQKLKARKSKEKNSMQQNLKSCEDVQDSSLLNLQLEQSQSNQLKTPQKYLKDSLKENDIRTKYKQRPSFSYDFQNNQNVFSQKQQQALFQQSPKSSSKVQCISPYLQNSQDNQFPQTTKNERQNQEKKFKFIQKNAYTPSKLKFGQKRKDINQVKDKKIQFLPKGQTPNSNIQKQDPNSFKEKIQHDKQEYKLNVLKQEDHQHNQERVKTLQDIQNQTNGNENIHALTSKTRQKRNKLKINTSKQSLNQSFQSHFSLTTYLNQECLSSLNQSKDYSASPCQIILTPQQMNNLRVSIDSDQKQDANQENWKAQKQEIIQNFIQKKKQNSSSQAKQKEGKRDEWDQKKQEIIQKFMLKKKKSIP